MPTMSPILRITIGILLLTLSLLLIGDLLGIVPNQKQSEIQARKVMAESLAIQISSQINEYKPDKIEAMLNSVVKRNQQIESIGLRKSSHELMVSSDKHETYWASRDDDRSSAQYLQVPIYHKESRWGTLEVGFVPLNSMFEDIFEGRSLAATLFFIFSIGFISYWLFLRRVLSELDPRSVVPERVRSALDILTEGLVILDVNERIILVNTAFKNKIGLSDAQLLGKHLSHLPWQTEAEDLPYGKKKLPWNRLLENDELCPNNTLKLKIAGQKTFTFNINVAPIKENDQKIKGVIVTIDDITELEKKNTELSRILERLEKSQDEISRQNSKLLELATQDPLTKLLNRRSLFEGMNILLREEEENNGVLSCIILDIDFFKLVNDTLGHLVGDRVIQGIAKLLQTMAGSDNIVGRYGGEEFLVVLPGLNESEAVQIAEEIRIAVFEKLFDELSQGLKITASFGVASTQSNVWESDKLIDQADQALYVAKQSGRNQVVCYSKKDRTKDVTKTHQITRINQQAKEKKTDLLYSKKTRDRKEHLVDTRRDPITINELSYHTIILDRLSQSCKQARRNRANMAVLTIYIDTIEKIHHTLGYASAEKLKKTAYERLKEIFRVSDTIMPEVDTAQNMSLSRASDSEFVTILSGIKNAEDTTWAIYRMFKELAEAVEIDGNEVTMTANIGASIYPVDGEDPEILLNNSKIALNKAKEEGRGSFLFYDKQMNLHSKQVLKIESQLHQAIEREEFYLLYQPIVDMQTGQVEKLETLIRWKHPEFGLVPPDVFIKISEHAGNIKNIGRWVLKNACQQLKKWHSNGQDHLTISVNLSPVELLQPSLSEDIMKIVEQEGILPEFILFELTETALVKQFDKTLQIIEELHSEGFKIALDDFGTGYSSLEYLHKFPVDLIKLDYSLMQHFPTDPDAVSIVSGIISLSHNLGISVVSEGVEDETQLEMLYSLGCDQVQGYVFSKPLSPNDVDIFFELTLSRRLVRKIKHKHSNKREIQDNTVLIDILNTPPV